MIYSVIGLAYGDEGKGRTVSALTRKFNPSAIVRFSGGSQAAHRVVVGDKEYIFAQFGSGSAVSSSVETYLSKQMVVDPISLLCEAEIHKKNGIDNLTSRLHVDPDCAVITIYAIAFGRTREIIRGEDRISTTGMGVGETFEDFLTNPTEVVKIKDLLDERALHNKLRFWQQVNRFSTYNIGGVRQYEKYLGKYSNLQDYEVRLLEVGKELGKAIDFDFCENLDKALDTSTVILEGSQGTLLDPRYGSKPYITKGLVTLSEVDKLVGRRRFSSALHIGVTRSYMVRHGKGPFATESGYLTELLPDKGNKENEWQGALRVGYLDFDLLRYSVESNPGLSGIAITCLDRLYQEPDLIGSELNLPVIWKSYSESDDGIWEME